MSQVWASAVLILMLVWSVACGGRHDAAAKQYQMTGVVVALDGKNQTATIKHGPIAGWMEAMTMEYPVKSKEDFTRLYAGEHITATVNVQGTDYDLTDVHKQDTPK